MNKNQIKEFFTQISEKRNNFALVAAVISLIAMFMPYATVSLWGFSESINYISTDDGKIYLILLIAYEGLYASEYFVIVHFINRGVIQVITAECALSLLACHKTLKYNDPAGCPFTSLTQLKENLIL